MTGLKNEIHTDRLLLRFLRADDVLRVYEITGDKGIDMMFYFPHLSTEEAGAYVERSLNQYNSGVPCDIEYLIEYEGRAAGCVSLNILDDCRAELGWVTGTALRGKGIATEAARAVIEMAARMGIKKVIAQCDSRNAASERVMQKLGMQLIDDAGIRVYPRTGIAAGEKTYELAL